MSKPDPSRSLENIRKIKYVLAFKMGMAPKNIGEMAMNEIFGLADVMEELYGNKTKFKKLDQRGRDMIAEAKLKSARGK
jgi:hypothetical protein